ncbi:hypothetical protein NQ315_015028 [Exocentrus adspersus]|uniref:Uncharacterized protein n=1 Tax=Exocentrus adspersus TaxID=1586481 RepID=A0AAV8VWR3_9CUCU|nr:hypothetical protein NQ315_015028 [Exocentrus adspersus]
MFRRWKIWFQKELRQLLGIHFIFYYNRAMTMYVVFSVVCIIKNSFKCINDQLTTVTHCSVISEDVLDVLKKITELYLDTNKAVECFNDIFGWPVFLCLSQNVVYLLFCFALLSDKKFTSKGGLLAGDIIAVNVLNAILGEWGSVVQIFFFDLAMQEAKKLTKTCYELEDALPAYSKEREELRNLSEIIQSTQTNFKAADFFEINRSTILALLGTTTTYMIVIIQFNFL